MKNKLVCVVCGKAFKPTSIWHPNQKYCSLKCRHTANYFDKEYCRDVDKNRKNSCIECSKNFYPTKGHLSQRFCSRECRSRFNARKYPKVEERKEKYCIICGKRFTPKNCQPFQKFCSLKCGRRAINKRRYWRYRKYMLEEHKNWRKTERGKYLHRLYAKTYGYKRRQLEGTKLGRKDLEGIMERDGMRCVYCKAKLTSPTFDHIISISKGGTNKRDNLVLSCHKCNSSRQDKNVREWCKSKGIAIPEIVSKLLDKQKKALG